MKDASGSADDNTAEAGSTILDGGVVHEETNFVLGQLVRQTPWWIVSVVFHILLIVLAYMFSIVVNLDTEQVEPLVTVTQLQRPAEPVDEKKKARERQ